MNLLEQFNEDPWHLLFANNAILVYETRHGLNAKLKIWRDV